MDTITVYSTPGCIQCRMTTQALERKGIGYTLVDLAGNNEALQQLREQGYSQAPVVRFGTTTWTGFRPDLIDTITR